MIKKEFLCKQGLNLQGKAISREAVRGIIRDDNMLYMIFSEVNGDYTFPGGGVQNNETHAKALSREILEECGAEVTYIDEPYAEIYEVDEALEEDFDIFKMKSTYYPCHISDSFHPLKLDDYEQALKLHPVWVTIAEAVLNNQIILHRKEPPAPRWTQRDLFILEKLLKDSLK